MYENIPKECENILKNIARENGGKISLSEEENKYIFKKTKNMFEGIVKNKIQKAEKKEEQNDENCKNEIKEVSKEEIKEEEKDLEKEEVKEEIKEEKIDSLN